MNGHEARVIGIVERDATDGRSGLYMNELFVFIADLN